MRNDGHWYKLKAHMDLLLVNNSCLVLCDIMRNDGHWYKLKAHMDLLLVNNTNSYPISHSFRVTTAYCQIITFERKRASI